MSCHFYLSCKAVALLKKIFNLGYCKTYFMIQMLCICLQPREFTENGMQAYLQKVNHYYKKKL